jgi:hypothetical protein
VVRTGSLRTQSARHRVDHGTIYGRSCANSGWLSERLGQPFVIENRPGAGSNIGTEAVVHAAPDGYMLGPFGAPSAINATLYDKLNFNFVRDIAPVAGIIRGPYVILVNPSVPAKTVFAVAASSGSSGLMPAADTSARIGAQGRSDRRAGQSGQYPGYLQHAAARVESGIAAD